MAELQPPESPIAAAPPLPTAAAATTTAAISTAPPPPLPETTAPHNINTTTTTNSVPSLAPKRQRRPSVRLGEIGDPLYDSHSSRRGGPKATTTATTTWRFHKHPTLAAKTSRTRPLTNLVNGGGVDNFDNNVVDESNYNVELVNRKSKSRKPSTKRVRSNWSSFSSKFEVSNGGAPEESFYREDNNDNAEFREFEPEEGSESPLKEHSPVNSTEHMGLQYWDRRGGTRAGVSETRDHHDNNLNDEGIGNETNYQDKSIGVRDWLIGLGLGRYAPVFEIHEVDDEVLPMLTLEDLKDMGINAVGSRRKMYTAILKLRKGFS